MKNASQPQSMFKVPLLKKIFLFIRKGVFVFHEILEIDTSVNELDYTRIDRLTRVDKEIVLHVYSSFEDFAVYDTFEGGVLCVSASSERHNDLNEIAKDLCNLKAQLTGKETVKFKGLLANAMMLGLSGKTEESKSILNDISEKVTFLRTNKFRLVYLLGAMSLSLSIVALTLAYQALNLTFHTNWDELKLLNILLFSSIGGIFSVALGYKSLNTNIPEAGWFFYVVNGMSRILISLFAGIVAYEFMMADFLFTIFKDNTYGIMCLAILAGFTETFIPKLLEKTTKESGK